MSCSPRLRLDQSINARRGYVLKIPIYLILKGANRPSASGQENSTTNPTRPAPPSPHSDVSQNLLSGGRDVLAVLGHTAAEEVDFAVTMLDLEAEEGTAVFQNVLSKM